MGFTWCTLLGCLLMLQKKRTLKFWILVFSAGCCSHKSEMVDGYLDNYVSNKLNETITNNNSYCRSLGTGYEPALPPSWLCFYFLWACQRSSLSSTAGCTARCCLRAATGSLFKLCSNISAPSSSSPALTLVSNTTLSHAPRSILLNCIGPSAPHKLASCCLINVWALHSPIPACQAGKLQLQVHFCPFPHTSGACFNHVIDANLRIWN